MEVLAKNLNKNIVEMVKTMLQEIRIRARGDIPKTERTVERAISGLTTTPSSIQFLHE